MSDDSDGDGGENRLDTLTFVLLAALIAVATMVVAAATADVLTPVSQNDDGVIINEPGGPTVNVTGNTKVYNTSGSSGLTVYVDTTDGNITFTAPDTAGVRVAVTHITGTYTNVSGLDVSNTSLKIDPADKPAVNVSGDADELHFVDDMAVDDGVVDFYVRGPSGSATVTVRGVAADTEIVAVDADTTAVLDVSTSDGSGTATFTIPLSDHSVLLQTNDGGPTLSDPYPEGNLSIEPQVVNVTVSDPDMPDDEVNVTFKIDGTVVGSDTVTSNGTAEVSINPDNYEGGKHTVTATAEDAAGATDTLKWTFQVPDTLKIYSESQPSTLITNASVTVRFFYESGGEQVYVTRNVTDGVVNLTGLPTSKPLVVSAETEDYYRRRIFLQDLYQQQTIYLLPTNKTSATVKFRIRDFTGSFPDDSTVLIVQRAINGSYRTVLGDYLGANGQFAAILRFNTRHRIRLLNTETGEMRKLGRFTPLSDGVQTLTVAVSGIVSIEGAQPIFELEPAAKRLPAQNITLRVRLLNQSADVTEYVAKAYLVNESGSTLLFNVSRDSPGTIERAVNLTGDRGHVTIVTTYKTSEGAVGKQTVNYTITTATTKRTTLLGQLGALVGLIPSGNQSLFATMLGLVLSMVGTVAVASRYRLPTEMTGGIGVMFVTGFAILGWVSYTLLFVAAVVWAALTVMRQVI